MCLEQDTCWSRPWRSATHMAALAALLSALSGFGGLAVLHSYLAATNQTTWELSAGAKARYVSEQVPDLASCKG